MLPIFALARTLHSAVARAAEVDPAAAASLWGAISGTAAPAPGSIGDAAQDARPVELLPVTTTNEAAAALAFDLLWRAPRHGRDASERRGFAREAWGKFSETAAAVQAFEEGFGFDRSAAWEHVRAVKPRDAKMIERIARLAGRMYAALKGAAVRKVPGMSGEVHSVELGGAVERLLPSVYAQMMDPDLEVPALYDVSRKRAPQYAIRGEEKRSRGPLVLCLDESGSMHGARNEWAKAAAIALARVAAADRRRVAVVHFSTSIRVVELLPADPGSVLRMVEHFLSGGTDIGLALDKGVEQIGALAASGAKGADLVVVSDGLDPESLEVQRAAVERAAKLHQARLWTVAIECEIAESSPLRAGAASYVELGGEQFEDAGSVVSLAGAAG